MTMEDYAQKKADFDKVNTQRQAIFQKIGEVVNAFRINPDGFHFSNAEGGFPPEVVMGRGNLSFDAKQWPSAQDIQNVLVLWHQRKREMLAGWDGLTPEQRGAMQPPDAGGRR